MSTWAVHTPFYILLPRLLLCSGQDVVYIYLAFRDIEINAEENLTCVPTQTF